MTDEELIRRTLAVYASMNDDHDPDGYAALYAEDGRLVTRSLGAIVGRPAIKRFIEGTFEQQGREGRAKHLCGNAIINIHGETADSTIDVVEYRRKSGDAPWVVHNVGRYHDRLVKKGDKWLFMERMFVPV